MSLRFVSLNLNGIRSAVSKGWLPWADSAGAHFMGVQELKAQADVCSADVHARVAGMQGHFHCAEKKGYSGVGLYSRHDPSDVITGFGVPEFDAEGRYVEARFDTAKRRFSVISCYFPSGSAGEHRQASKWRFLAAIYPHLVKLKAERDFVLLGDVNIAHQAIDLENWRGNQKNSGFLPDERAWVTRLLDEVGLVDVFRRLNQQPGQYTWWSNRGQAWAKNVGWRIDYHLATPAIAAKARREEIYLAQRFSDHAPLIIDYDLKL